MVDGRKGISSTDAKDTVVVKTRVPARKGRMRFIHMLLFECPECNCPVATAQITDHQLEAVDGMIFQLRCDHCVQSFQVLGHTKKRHFIFNSDTRGFNSETHYANLYTYQPRIGSDPVKGRPQTPRP